ncbi:MAG: metal-sulfur cluster assembly factor [Actinomycetaceae bacterium]|nr:metal-sulfur cluster assembly factor [Actinomycetaceae bacterium]
MIDNIPGMSEPSDNAIQNSQEAMTSVPTIDDPTSVAEIEEALRDVIDPELGINIVDLGLLYGVHLYEKDVVLDMTLTSPACPLTDVIEDQCRMMLADLAETISINWVWMPPWGPDKITEEGRDQLRTLGFNV